MNDCQSFGHVDATALVAGNAMPIGNKDDLKYKRPGYNVAWSALQMVSDPVDETTGFFLPAEAPYGGAKAGDSKLL